MPSSTKTLPAIRHALVNRYRRNNQPVKIQKSMTRIDDKHPALASWIRKYSDESVLWLKDIKAEQKGIKTSRDIDPERYIMVNEGYFRTPKHASPFLYVRREEIDALAKAHRNTLIERYKNSKKTDRMAAIIQVLIEMGHFEAVDDDVVDYAETLGFFLKGKAVQVKTVNEAMTASKFGRLENKFSLKVNPSTAIRIDSVSIGEENRLSIVLKVASKNPVWKDYVLHINEHQDLLERPLNEQCDVLTSYVLNSDQYRECMAIESIFNEHQTQYGLSDVSLGNQVALLCREIDIHAAPSERIQNGLAISNIIQTAFEYGAFSKSKSGSIKVACYIAPSLEAKNAKAAVIEVKFTFPTTSPNGYLLLMDEIIETLPSEVLYSVNEAREVIKQNDRTTGKKKKRGGHPKSGGVKPLVREFQWDITHPREEIPGLLASMRVWDKMTLAERIAASIKAPSPGVSYYWAPAEKRWFIFIKTATLAPFEITFPSEKMSTPDDIAACELSIVAMTQSVMSFLNTQACQVSLALIHQYNAHRGMPNPQLRLSSFTSVDSAVSDITDRLKDRLERMHQIAEDRKIQEDRQKQFEAMVSERPYHEFMYRANKPRNVICYIAPTNAGKSWRARQDMIQSLADQPHRDAVALFPLRMLALENQLWFQDHGVDTSLVTGEERDCMPGDRLTCQTVETLDNSRTYSTVMVDEAQLTFDMNRGPAYLRALVSTDCDTLLLTASPDARKKIETLFASINERVEFIELDRLCPLKPIRKKLQPNDIQRGDLIVVFSTKVIHQIATSLKDRGFSVGTLYGGMPPTTRRHMMDSYQAGNIDVMVSTDAIGMGCNCPVDRVLFAQTDKFDGQEFRPLTAAEFKQVAGRAGRYGLAEVGYFGIVDFGRFPLVGAKHLADAVVSAPDVLDMHALYALPDREVFLGSDLSLMETLTSWVKAVSASASSTSYSAHGESIQEMYAKADFLDEMIQSGKLDRGIATRLLFVAFNYDKQGDIFQKWVHKVAKGNPIHYLKEIKPNKMHRSDLEESARVLAILAQFQRIVPGLCPAEDDIMEMNEEIGDIIYRDLVKRYSKVPVKKKVG